MNPRPSLPIAWTAQKKFRYRVAFKKLLADTLTPVGLYLKLRDQFANTILLESSDYRGRENGLSILAFKPLAGFEVQGLNVTEKFPDTPRVQSVLASRAELIPRLEGFLGRFHVDSPELPFSSHGVFGYMTYEAVTYCEDMDLKAPKLDRSLPDLVYYFYQYLIVIDPFHNELHLIENIADDDPKDTLKYIESLIRNRNAPVYPFQAVENERSEMTDEKFRTILAKGRDHCFRGDVFQIVLSRSFRQKFSGDEFNVYRALRSINPSPYLFFFDHGGYKIFGSSPEAQLQIKDGIASIHPIAGTYRRTGLEAEDRRLAERLLSDDKENAEHVMLVDLARNDLSRSGKDVRVEIFREVQLYSHVIHLVSKVCGRLAENVGALRLAADTFPAGTLTGAPKYRAMELIDRYESHRRGYYGGAIGFLGFNGDFNHAIMIRSFLSEGGCLHYQAGAGVTAGSVIENEFQEVNHKLSALRSAVIAAEEIV